MKSVVPTAHKSALGTTQKLCPQALVEGSPRARRPATGKDSRRDAPAMRLRRFSFVASAVYSAKGQPTTIRRFLCHDALVYGIFCTSPIFCLLQAALRWCALIFPAVAQLQAFKRRI